jgi:hypothetical protein
MSVSNVMDTMMQQDASETMGASTVNTGQPAGSSGNGKPVVGCIDDIFNLYSSSGDEAPADKNGVELKEEEKNIPDELNNPEVKKEEKKEEKEEEKKPEAKEEPKEEKLTNLPDKVKVKVNGLETEVPLQDVINSYSGQQEIQRRFTEFDKQKKTWEKESAQEKEFTNYVKEEIGTLRGSLDGLVRQYEKSGYLDKNPLEVVNQLLDNMGINSNLFERALFEHQLPDYAKYFNMSDVERDAYFTRKENEFLRKKEQSLVERDSSVKLREQKQRQDLDLIKSAGLDDTTYDSLSRELLDAGHSELSAEKVVEYAKQKPTLDKVVQVFQEIGSDPSKDERAKTVFKLFSEFPELTTEEVLEHLDPNRAAIKSAKILQQKQPKNIKVQPQNDEDDELTEQLSYFRR